MNLKEPRTIQLCLTGEVMYNVMDEETTTGLWSRLKTLYMTKSLSNKLYLKKIIWVTHDGRDNSVESSKLVQQDHQGASCC